ncbi:hypothetical protein PINS_up014154 [Pythium insidiosum]|nr:hypothetical protein PINS_up014154 [Pythium insidiosum]
MAYQKDQWIHSVADTCHSRPSSITEQAPHQCMLQLAPRCLPRLQSECLHSRAKDGRAVRQAHAIRASARTQTLDHIMQLLLVTLMALFRLAHRREGETERYPMRHIRLLRTSSPQAAFRSLKAAYTQVSLLLPSERSHGLIRQRFRQTCASASIANPTMRMGSFALTSRLPSLTRRCILYQSEIDFFFRCFECADVSLVVKGMTSELNQYIWAWPFILESCGTASHFTFDHFQFRQKPGGHPELDFVGTLRLSMATYNAYLERYLSGGSGKDVIVLEDFITKKPLTIVASENIIALNDLAISKHCSQLYNDLIKSFQWDMFAGGIHCLLQYLPQACRQDRFSSPHLHFSFPGARGSLRDPGNGTTDQAYQVLVGSLELVIFERLDHKDRDAFHRALLRAGYDPATKAMLLDSHLRCLRDAGFSWSTVLLSDGEFVHVNKGRIHFWRVVESEGVRGPAMSPCVFLSWEWVYQGVSQRGISTECWFAMKSASLCPGGWAFDPRRAIVEAAKCGVAIVRTGEFLNSLSGPGAPPALLQLAFTASPSSIERDVVAQRQEQMVLFLESILPCLEAIVEEEYQLGMDKDDSEDFRKIFDDEAMWKVVDTSLARSRPHEQSEYECGVCGIELTNVYKQCLGCTVHSRRSRPNMAYSVFRLCLRCHRQPEQHLFKPRSLHRFYEKLCSSEGHTGLLPATRRYQSERSYFKCRCAPYVRCAYCGGCESCCCLCHTLFQTRFRYSSPEHLDSLRADVVDVIKWHKQHHR